MMEVRNIDTISGRPPSDENCDTQFASLSERRLNVSMILGL
jgi:hypothetical protein